MTDLTKGYDDNTPREVMLYVRNTDTDDPRKWLEMARGPYSEAIPVAIDGFKAMRHGPITTERQDCRFALDTPPWDGADNRKWLNWGEMMTADEFLAWLNPDNHANGVYGGIR